MAVTGCLTCPHLSPTPGVTRALGIRGMKPTVRPAGVPEKGDTFRKWCLAPSPGSGTVFAHRPRLWGAMCGAP